MRPGPQTVSRMIVSVAPSAPVVLSNGLVDVAISPDGTRLVYQAGADGQEQLEVRVIDQLGSQPLSGPERPENPFMSPDGTWVGFAANAGSGPLQKVSVLGGPPVTLCELPAELRGASWGIDDVIIFGTASGGGLMRVSAAGGDPEQITTPEGPRHIWPDILPGGAGCSLPSTKRRDWGAKMSRSSTWAQANTT